MSNIFDPTTIPEKRVIMFTEEELYQMALDCKKSDEGDHRQFAIKLKEQGRKVGIHPAYYMDRDGSLYSEVPLGHKLMHR